jgi:hypothetical protein
MSDKENGVQTLEGPSNPVAVATVSPVDSKTVGESGDIAISL